MLIFFRKNDLISGGEDGVVNIWDLREKQPVNKIKPYENDKIARPELGKWIGAVNLNEDWLVRIIIIYVLKRSHHKFLFCF